jgi:acetyltransferase
MDDSSKTARRHSAEQDTLQRIFNARTIAVVGASDKPQKPGFNIYRLLQDFPGEVFPVTTKAAEVGGIKAYPNLSAIGRSVDLVVLAIPAPYILDVLRKADIDIGGCVIVSSGYAETDEEGRRRQAEIEEVCRQKGIRVIGPNTAGFMNPGRRLLVTFVPETSVLQPGNVGIISQSGAINIIFSYLAHQAGLGISLAVGLGNMMDVAHDEVVTYLAEDSQTDVILVYAEGISRGRELFDAVRKAIPRKPVIVLLVGKTDIGEFASSHTGNLIGSYKLKRSALQQAGAVVVDSVTEAIDAVNVMSRYRMPAKANPGFGIVTGQAGPGMMILDSLKEHSIDVPKLSAATVASIETMLPPLTFIENPVDTGRPSSTFIEILRCVGEDEQIDALVAFALDEPDAINPDELLPVLKEIIRVPILFGTVSYESSTTAMSAERISELGVPTFAAPERVASAAVALARDARHRATLERLARDPAPDRAMVMPTQSTPVDEAQAKELLSGFGFAIPNSRVCDDHNQVRGAFGELTKPVVMKLLDAEIAHKTDVGGVHLDISTGDQLNNALATIDQIAGGSNSRRYLVEEMAPPGIDLILGGKNDAVFGPVIMLGLGGIAAEALDDVVMRLAPISVSEASDMIAELRCAKLLDGWRGAAPVDKEALVETLVSLSCLIDQNRQIVEMDLNPVRANADGVMILDALIQIEGSRSA